MTARAQFISGLRPDGYSSESTANIGSYPNSFPLGSLLKDGNSPTMTAQTQPISDLRLDGYSMSQQPISGFTLTATPQGVLKDGNSTIMTAGAQPISGFLPDGYSMSQQFISGPTLTLPLGKPPEKTEARPQ